MVKRKHQLFENRSHDTHDFHSNCFHINRIIVLQKSHDSFGATELTEAEDWILGIQQVLTRIHNVSYGNTGCGVFKGGIQN